MVKVFCKDCGKMVFVEFTKKECPHCGKPVR
jgi:ribosomal protein L37E